MKHVLYIILLLILASCTSEEIDFADSELVVEGWIEDGEFPVVMLTRSFPITEEETSIDDLSDYLVRWAKVSVTDGQDTVVLTGKVDNAYYPPYIYTTSHMRGEAGKTYRLIVEYDQYYATAETTVPPPAVIDSFRVEKCQDSDTLYQVKAYLNCSKEERKYYQFFTYLGTDSRQYLASFMGSIDNAETDGYAEVPVFRPHLYRSSGYTPYFSKLEFVAVKCCRMDATSYNFWNTFMKNSYLDGSAILTTVQSIPSNIQGGAGYWCGFGSAVFYVTI